MRNPWALVMWLLPAGVGFAETASSPLGAARNALDHWVEARQLISETQTEWASEKETLRASAAVFEKELADLADRFAKLDERGVEAGRESEALEKEKAELGAVVEVAQRHAVDLEGRLPRLLNRLPTVLVERLQPSIDQLPKDSSDTRMTVVQRLQTLVGILLEIDKFASSITVESEIRKTAAGAEVEVQTLYLGLTQAYFVGEAGKFAGVGMPADEGWKWEARSELAPAVQKAIAVYRSDQPAAFVPLPVLVN